MEWYDEASGRIDALHGAGEVVEGERLVGVGSYAVVVDRS